MRPSLGYLPLTVAALRPRVDGRPRGRGGGVLTSVVPTLVRLVLAIGSLETQMLFVRFPQTAPKC